MISKASDKAVIMCIVVYHIKDIAGQFSGIRRSDEDLRIQTFDSRSLMKATKDLVEIVDSECAEFDAQTYQIVSIEAVVLDIYISGRSLMF